MKRAWSIFALLIFVITSCSDEKAPEIIIDTNILSNGITLEHTNTEKFISFTSTDDWTLSIDNNSASWLTAFPMNGGKGESVIMLKTSENTDDEERSVTISINSGETNKTFIVIQKGIEILLASPLKYEIPQEGEEIEIEVKSNTKYHIEISQSAKNWIQEITSRNIHTEKHIFNIQTNNNIEDRNGEILIKGTNITDTIKINQAGFGLYYNWEKRNQAYIDSIAQIALATPNEWKVIHTYKFDPPMNDPMMDVNDYVYCKILEKGEGLIKPLYIDSVSVHYRGKLIPRYDGSTVTFDQSYSGQLDTQTAIPAKFCVSSVIEGWTTALQHMVEGDHWEVYIPYKLAFGELNQSSVPGYSTLIFDMQMVKIHRKKIE